ncbi:MAG: DUF1570 domain-containing protein [Pirellulales bacterium]|nr:DUF1570 domain-containing protein [Pirellulales bacterium]
MIPRNTQWLLRSLVVCFAAAGPASALDHVVFEHEGHRRQVDGRIVVEAKDGGLLLMARDGVLWTVPPEENISRTSDDEPFVPLTHQELAVRLLGELPPGFTSHQTVHYLVLHNSSRTYARWCGALFERLYMAFSNYWKRKGFALPEPEFPLVAVVFADRASYERFAQSELGQAAGSILGYYNLQTNRMTMCDLTGVSAATPGQRIRSAAWINEILSRPESLMMVATIVHEATHQIAYNRGMHARFGDCPLWFSEGLAVYFESPDLSSDKGWRGIGEVNHMRLARFAQYSRRRPGNSLATLISKDDRFRNSATAMDAYAEAWALTYFLIRKRSGDYLKYLTQISQKKPFVWDSPETRLNEFQAVFGDLEELDREFLRYMQRVR